MLPRQESEAREGQPLIAGSETDFLKLTKQEQSSAWAWCSASAAFSADLLSERGRADPNTKELKNIATASENTILFCIGGAMKWSCTKNRIQVGRVIYAQGKPRKLL